VDYFTLSELRALPDMGDTVKYPDARLTAAGDWIEAIIEREVRTSFVARQVTETLDGDSQDPDGGLLLSKPYVLEVTAVTSNGAAFDAGQLAELSVRAGRAYRRTAGTYSGFIPWDAGTRNIVVTYDAGYVDAPPFDVKEAALQGARYRVLSVDGKSGISDRATSITNEFGNVQLSTPNTERNRPTGLPEVDAVIVGWRDKLAPRFGFA
jgi:hypothetical protein